MLVKGAPGISDLGHGHHWSIFRLKYFQISNGKNLDSFQWRHNGRNGISNHQPHDCSLNRLFRCRSKKTSKQRITGLCAGDSPVTGEFPEQMASYAENVSIWWRHHELVSCCTMIWGFVCQKEVSGAGTNNHISQILWVVGVWHIRPYIVARNCGVYVETSYVLIF